LGRGLGIIAQSVNDFERRERDTVGELADFGAHGVTAAVTMRAVHNTCKRDPELERAFWYLRSEVWFQEPFVATKQLIDLLRRLTRRWTPRTDDDDTLAVVWLTAEAVSIFALNAVTIARLGLTLDRADFNSLVGESLAEGIVPAHQARRLSESIDRYVSGLLSATNASPSVRVDAVGAFLPEPPDYADSYAELLWRLSRTPLAARSLPRQIDLLLFERLVRGREAPVLAAVRLGLGRGDGARLRRELAVFLRGANASVEILDSALRIDVTPRGRSNTEQAQLPLFNDPPNAAADGTSS
jgi:hypothetical protein